MQEEIKKFKQLLENEIKTAMRNISNAGAVNPDNVCMLKDSFKLLKLLNEYEDEGMSNGDSYGYSNRRGRSMTTGRFVSRDQGGSYGSYDGGSYYGGASNRGSYDGSYQGGYSGHNPQIMSQLEEMMNNAKNDQERQMIGDWMRHAESL